MAKYRKKPVVIEAEKWDGDVNHIVEFAGEAVKVDEVRKSAITESGYIPAQFDITIHTLEGDMKANLGDYIIKGVNGEFYPCKPDIFEKTYEKEN